MNGESKINGNGTASNGSQMNGSSTNQISSKSFYSLSLYNLRRTITIYLHIFMNLKDLRSSLKSTRWNFDRLNYYLHKLTLSIQ